MIDLTSAHDLAASLAECSRRMKEFATSVAASKDSRVNTLPHSMLAALVLPSLVEMFGGQATVGRQQPIGRGRIVGHDAGGLRRLPRRGRNQPCGCGSGRKFKHCCGAT